MLPPTGPGPGGPPPAAIQIGGPNHGAPAPPPGPDSNGPGDPDAPSVADKLRKALKLITAAADQEGDDGDTAGLHDIAAKISKAIANETGLADKVMGGGDGAKLIRKAASSGPGY
jgi:hypothetical protein